MQVSKERLPYNVSGDHSNSASKGSMPTLGEGIEHPHQQSQGRSFENQLVVKQEA
jgi:hypothetical protein